MAAELLWNFLQEFYWEIILGIIVFLFGAIYYFGRDRIRIWLFARKVTPKISKAVSVLEKEILPDFVETKPKVKVVRKREELPTDLPFGYIFIPEGEEEIIWNTLLAYLPVSSSLKKIRILFDETLRKSLFDLLSYKLGEKLGMEELAVGYRDNALNKYGSDFKAMESLYNDNKLTTIILLEAAKRFRITNGYISTSDVEEFSTLVRKISKIDAIVVRVGDSTNVAECCEDFIKTKRGIVLLARGRHIEKAITISDKLTNETYERIPPEELQLSNPEEGIWHFANPKKDKPIPFMRIWLRPRAEKVVRKSKKKRD